MYILDNGHVMYHPVLDRVGKLVLTDSNIKFEVQLIIHWNVLSLTYYKLTKFRQLDSVIGKNNWYWLAFENILSH